MAEQDHHLLGYAYASSFHDRAAYDWAVETSIYVAQDKKGVGIGRLLHDALEAVLKEQGILNMNACIESGPASPFPILHSSFEGTKKTTLKLESGLFVVPVISRRNAESSFEHLEKGIF